MKTIHTEITIDAPPERVWQVLIDFASYPQWNPSVLRARGKAEAGARLELYIQTPAGWPMTLHPILLAAEPNRELRWRGRLWFRGLLDGEHSFMIQAISPGRAHFIQREVFTGWLVRFFEHRLEEKIGPAFDQTNRALKARVEAGIACDRATEPEFGRVARSPESGSVPVR